MVVIPSFDALRLLDAATGEVLFGNDLGHSIFGAATVANSRLFIGDTGSFAHAFRYPSGSTSAGAGELRITVP